jgi:hypothetical protein
VREDASGLAATLPFDEAELLADAEFGTEYAGGPMREDTLWESSVDAGFTVISVGADEICETALDALYGVLIAGADVLDKVETSAEETA